MSWWCWTFHKNPFKSHLRWPKIIQIQQAQCIHSISFVVSPSFAYSAARSISASCRCCAPRTSKVRRRTWCSFGNSEISRSSACRRGRLMTTKNVYMGDIWGWTGGELGWSINPRDCTLWTARWSQEGIDWLLTYRESDPQRFVFRSNSSLAKVEWCSLEWCVCNMYVFIVILSCL